MYQYIDDYDPDPHNLLTRSLTKDEYEYIKDLKEKNSKISFRDITTKAKKIFKRLSDFSHTDISIMYHTYFEDTWPMRENIKKFFNDAKNQDELIDMILDPENYLKNHCYPFFLSRSGEKWTKSEITFLERVSFVAKDRSIFKFLALCFPGRSSQQVYAKYVELVNKGIIDNDVRKIKPAQNKLPPIRKYFIDSQEELFASEILVMFNEGRFISKETIRQRARSFYMMPWVMAQRAAYQIFWINKSSPKIYNDDSCTTFTEEFIECTNDILNEILPEGEVDPDPEAQIRLIEHLKLPEAKFSDAWAQAFMKRNHFSFRLAHYSRRGSINQKHINIFLDQLSSAVIKYT